MALSTYLDGSQVIIKFRGRRSHHFWASGESFILGNAGQGRNLGVVGDGISYTLRRVLGEEQAAALQAVCASPHRLNVVPLLVESFQRLFSLLSHRLVVLTPNLSSLSNCAPLVCLDTIFELVVDLSELLLQSVIQALLHVKVLGVCWDAGDEGLFFFLESLKPVLVQSRWRQRNLPRGRTGTYLSLNTPNISSI